MISKKTKILSIKLIISICCLIFFPLMSQADVTLAVGDGSGFIGSSGLSSVDVSLDNPDDKIRGVQVDICDVDDYLIISNSNCETTDRTTGFTCSTNELDDGCVRIMLFGMNSVILIEEGSGAIFTLEYDILSSAPAGQCRTLNQENALVIDEYNAQYSNSTILESGEFCFYNCSINDDCVDELHCNGIDTCGDGICVHDDPCIDGQYCNGVEGCNEDNNECTPGDNPCTLPLLCDEENDICVDCLTDDACDDGLFCNGAESCDSGVCQPGTNPCQGHVCDEDSDACVECLEDADCNDSLHCNGEETCDTGSGTCQVGTDPCPDDGLYCTGVEGCDEDSDICTQSGDPCPGQVCDEDGDACVDCQEDGDCNDSLYCNGEETCDTGSGTCQIGTDPCPDDGLYCTGVEGCDEDSDICIQSGDPCPGQICGEDGDACIDCQEDADCDDSLYCNGEETCDDGVCQSGSNPCPGQSCNEKNDECEIITTSTTTTIVTPPPPPPPPPPPSCDVSVSPSSADVDSGGTLQFTALTMCDGQEVEGEYLWEIEPESTIGSTIDEDGLFAAGDNTTDFEIEETVKVTDTAHDNKSNTAIVTINVKEKPVPECEVTVNPSSATVSSGETVSLVEETTGEGCLAGDYEWSIDSEIESVVDPEGNYTAGINTTGGQATDVITVVDRANSDISTTVMITVESNIVSVLPAKLMGSRWVPLFYFLLITTEDTSGFDPSSTSAISFEPADDVLPVGHMEFGNVILAMVILTANPQEGTVDIIVDTGGEIVTGKLTIQLLPFIFAEDGLDNPEPGKEIPL